MIFFSTYQFIFPCLCTVYPALLQYSIIIILLMLFYIVITAAIFNKLGWFGLGFQGRPTQWNNV
jgi:hypothetical protein